MAKLLLDHQCEVDPVDADGETPLYKASGSDVEMCQLLVRTIIMLMLLLFIFKRYAYSASIYVHNFLTIYYFLKDLVCIFVRNNLKHHFSKTRLTSTLTSLAHFGP